MDDDGPLLDRARGGDSSAYGQLVARHQETAFRVAFVITRDTDDAADAAQQAFIKAYRALATFRAGSPFRPWLVRIVANEARNARRAAGARARLSLRLGGGGAEPSPEEAVIAEERRRRVLGAVERARPADRLVIACRYFLDLDEAEMATVLDCPVGTVKSRLSRALARLRADVKADAWERTEGEER